MKTPDMLDGVIGAAIPFYRDYSIGIIVDNFAGGGGASTGIESATGRDIDVAINHDEEAIAMHTANHPRTRHHCQSIWSIDPLDAVTIDGTPQPVQLAWFSPDCTHHSNARGGKPREKGIRDLAWVVVSWVERLGPKLKPAIIKVENVEEFLTWGPLDEEGKRIPGRNGEEFAKWVAALRRHGYKVEWKVLKASRYGTPTIRKRLCLIARCDGLPVVWPAETNGPGTPAPYRTAAECIDWSIPCPSIFLTKEEGRAIGVKRPLADATMARIAKGIQRYVINAAQPFIVNLTHHDTSDRTEAVDEPFRTITGATVTDFIARGDMPLNLAWDWPRAVAAADDWHDRLSAGNAKALFGVMADQIVDLGTHPDHTVLYGLEFVALRTPTAIHAEAKAMHHCVASYVQAVVHGLSNIVSIRRDEQRVATLELRNGRVEQLKGRFNMQVPREIVEAARTYAEDNRKAAKLVA